MILPGWAPCFHSINTILFAQEWCEVRKKHVCIRLQKQITSSRLCSAVFGITVCIFFAKNTFHNWQICCSVALVQLAQASLSHLHPLPPNPSCYVVKHFVYQSTFSFLLAVDFSTISPSTVHWLLCRWDACSMGLDSEDWEPGYHDDSRWKVCICSVDRWMLKAEKSVCRF